jgi:hypothetical protein
MQILDFPLQNSYSERVNWSDKTAWRGDAMLDSIRGVLAFIQVNAASILCGVI